MTRNSLCKRFTELRRDVSRLPGYSSHITRYTLKYQADAWKAASRDGGFPRFKSKRWTPSFTIAEKVKIRDGKLHIPKIGWLTMRRKGGNPYPDGKPVRAVVRKVAGKWCVTVCYAAPAPEIADNGVTAGVDMNVPQVAVVTTEDKEELIHAPDTRMLDTKIKRVQRKLARQDKGSRRRAKTKSRLQRLERKRADVRRNWQHQASRRIAGQASTVVVEDLNIKGMTRSAKGTAVHPGKNVRANTGREPEDTERRLARPQADAAIQGQGGDRGRSRLYQSALPCMRACRQGIPERQKIQMRGLRPCGSCGPQCGPQHTGVRDWRCCTARSLDIGHHSYP